jgi:anti-sigma B factor antagonist
VEEAVDGDAFMVGVEATSPAVVRLHGELDLAGVPRLLSALADLDGDVALDCSGLDFIDAAGLGAFVRAHRQCAARGAELVVVDPSPALLRLLRIVELDTELHLRRDGAAS